MKTPFKEFYKGIIDNIGSHTDISNQIEQLIDKADYSDINDWFRAHALCEIAFENSSFGESEKKLYKQIYSEFWNYHCSINLSDSDYKTWFEICKNFNDKLIEYGYNRAYCEQYDLLDHARIDFKDNTIANDYLIKGVEKNDPACLANYGEKMCYGDIEEEGDNEEKGLAMIQRSKELGYENARSYELALNYFLAKSEEEAKKAIDDNIDYIEKDKKEFSICADFYYKTGDVAKAIEYAEKGIANDDVICKFRMGTYIINQVFPNEETERGINLLNEALDYGFIPAGHFLGCHYLYSEYGDKDIDKSISYFEKSMKYGDNNSAFELGMIYLYDTDKKDLEKGMQILNDLIEKDYYRAMDEKAFIILENQEVEKDVSTAKILLEEALALGSDYAPYRIGIGYQNAEFSETEDFVKALEYLEIAAARNNLSAIEVTAKYYQNGYAGETKPEKAVENFKKAIENFNSNYSRIELGICYEQGYGVEKDNETARKLYEEALDNGYSYAAIRLAYLYEDNSLGEPNEAKALEYFFKAAEAEIGEAYYNIGRYNRFAIGIDENSSEAIKYFQKAVEMNYIPAFVDLAMAYENGYGSINADPKKALEYMTIAAEQDFPYAQYKLGCYYCFDFLEENDLNQAKMWFEKAYKNNSSLAALALGDFFLYNYDGNKEYDNAFEYYLFAKDNGYINEGIGICYEYGVGVETDMAEAFKYYKSAAESGYSDAIYRLGICYYFGNGTDKDKEEAFYFLKQSAENNNTDAKYYIGKMLLKGEGTLKDLEQGIYFLEQAAEENQNRAQYELANCFLKGEGVTQDDELALEWYKKAADNGNEDAKKVLGISSRKRK